MNINELKIGTRVVYIRNEVRYIAEIFDIIPNEQEIIVRFENPHIFCRELSLLLGTRENFANQIAFAEMDERKFRLFNVSSDAEVIVSIGEMKILQKQRIYESTEMITTISGKTIPMAFSGSIPNGTEFYSFYDAMYLHRCEGCGELVNTYPRYDSDFVKIYSNKKARWTCYHKHCADNDENIFVCPKCNWHYFVDETSEDAKQAHLCEECYSETLEDVINPYHTMKEDCNYHFKGDTCGNSYPYMGFELETENFVRTQCLLCASEVRNLFNDFVSLEEDGSIQGFELITQPATYDYHKSLESSYSKLMDIYKKYKQEDTNSCGLHVHINRTFFDREEKGVVNILAIVDKFWEEIKTFSRRDIEKLERWAKKNSTTINDDENEDRYMAVNLTNYDTIEFRIFRATTDVTTLLETLRFVNNIAILAKNLTLENISTLTWDNIFSDEFVHNTMI